nr:unnamed protein product [Digitaria exilis]
MLPPPLHSTPIRKACQLKRRLTQQHTAAPTHTQKSKRTNTNDITPLPSSPLRRPAPPQTSIIFPRRVKSQDDAIEPSELTASNWELEGGAAEAPTPGTATRRRRGRRVVGGGGGSE